VGERRFGSQRQSFGSRVNLIFRPVILDLLGSKSIGTLVQEGKHQPFRAVACPINGLNYDESQMKEANFGKSEQKSHLEYDC